METTTSLIDLYQIAEIEIVYKSKVKASERPQITSSLMASQLLRQYWNSGTLELLEEFKILFLNRANKVLGIYQHSKGSISGTIADQRLVYAAAIKAGATGIILAHNHPSGNLKYSVADIELTKKFKNAGTILDIQVHDHIILTAESYYSFADEGLL